MKRKITVVTLCALLFALCHPTEAQQTGKIPRIGFLDVSTASGSAVLDVEAFRQELPKLGWIEGKNIAIEYRFAEGKFDRLPGLAADLVRLKVDLIVTTGRAPALAAKSATTTIPIVMMNFPDPVGEGLVASLARPGGNVTGFSGLSYELSTKRLEILKDAVPKLARVGVLQQGGTAPADLSVKELRAAALALKLKLEEIRPKPTPKVWKARFKPQSRSRLARLRLAAVAPFSPKESGSSSLPPNTGCLLFTHGRGLLMRAV
jgi:putative tryptophan/tyrosine transport system substrate-binding protein